MIVQSLEDRRVLALLGIVPGSPAITANNTGSVQYDADGGAAVGTGRFTADAQPLLFDFFSFINAPSDFDLAFDLDSSGNFVGGVPGDDFTLTGSIDIDFDFVDDVSGVLLTGEVAEFGFADGSPTTTDEYDLRLTVTGGALSTAGVLSGGGLRPAYFDGFDIGLVISSEDSNFTGDFSVDFDGGNKSTLGPIEQDNEIPVNPDIDIIKYVDKVITTPEMHVIDFDNLSPGDYVSNQYPGVVINGVNNRTGFQNAAMVFDSAAPTGEDPDLGTPNEAFGGPGIGVGGATNTDPLGNILIISEDNDTLDPDDEAQGGSFTFTFDEAVTINHLDLLDIDSNEAGGSVVTLTTASGTTSIPIPVLGDNSYQRLPVNVDEVTSMTVNFVSSGAITELKFTKFTSEKVWFDANTEAEAVDFELGETVEFSYHVTNPGDVELFPVVVVDDNATPNDPSDDFNPTPVEDGGFNVGDTDMDGRLDPGEEWIYTFEIIASHIGCFTNVAEVTGTPIDENGDRVADDVTADDPANYCVLGNPDIDIIKYVDKVVETSEMHVVDFDGLHKGDIVSDQFPGVTITGVNSRTGYQNAAMIFNSANPTGGDYDLGTPNQAFGGPGQGSGGASNTEALGNILIISEDNDSSDPDDEAHGGVFTFDFDEPVTVNYLDVLDIDNNEPGGSVVTLTTASGTQTVAIPTAGNNSYQRLDINVDEVTSMTVEFVSSGAITEFKFTKFDSEKMWFDANTPEEAVYFDIGETVEFSYHVTNPGDVELFPVVVVDDNATPNDPSDDFNPTPVESGGFNVGDDDMDGRLDPGEEWIYTAEIVATHVGCFTNIAEVTGTPVDKDGNPAGDDVTADDPGNYKVVGNPDIDIEKLTNGHDADTPEEAVEIAAGDTVTWTYLVTNTGDTTFTEAEVVVVDDAGTPGDTSDDFFPTLVESSDVGNDGLLSPGEVWTFEASDTAQAVVSSGDSVTIFLDGSSSLDGPDGNIRSYTQGGVSVNASAFSRDGSGTWEEAWLGAYSGGLGVTDTSEGDGSGSRHRVDNIGRLNYVLFEFSEAVVPDAAFLASVVDDSDLSVWIGNVPGAFDNHITLSDSVLSSLGFYEENLGSGSDRWADFNSQGVAGNVLVLAAWVDDHTPEDQFKIRKLKFDTVQQGVYGNIGSVDTGEVSDSDPSHYTNPAPEASGVIGDFVWNDLDRDGKQDSDEPGVAGVDVTLFDGNGNVVGTTTTGANGEYEFTGLEEGSYKVGVELPNDFVFTARRSSVNDALDSNINQLTGKTDLIHLDAHEVDRSIDAGIYEVESHVMFEAEDYEWLDHPWRVKHDSNASGGQYLTAPNGSGSYYNSPPYGKKVMYQFNVDAGGSYELSALIRAKNSKDNSLWVRVDGGHWIQWHTPVTGYDYEWHSVTDGWHHDSVTFSLDAGHHTLEIKVREDGLRVDKFKVSKLATQTVVIDATAFDTKTGSWTVDVDDDGNEFLVATHGTHYHTPPVGDELTYEFTLAEDGVFDMYALVSAQSTGDNSFWIAIDDGEWVEWHLNVTGDTFEWQQVTNGSAQEAVQFDLDAGVHTLKIKVREDGTRLDKIVITNDQTIDLTDL